MYGLPNYSIDYVMTETPVPLGWMRSVYALQAAFALESFIDELAVAARKRSAAVSTATCWRRIRTCNTSRRPGTQRACAGCCNWPPRKRDGTSLFPPDTIAESHASAASRRTWRRWSRSRMENDQPRVHRVVAAVDCGQVVNPAILEQQIQGGIVYGLANALRAKITIEKGRVVQGNFDDYAPLRMEETPAVEVYAVPSAESPTGIGEPSVPPVAPALCNAIYAATKKRIRALPILS